MDSWPDPTNVNEPLGCCIVLCLCSAVAPPSRADRLKVAQCRRQARRSRHVLMQAPQAVHVRARLPTWMGLGDRTPISSIWYSFLVFMSFTVSPRRMMPSFTRKYTTTPCHGRGRFELCYRFAGAKAERHTQSEGRVHVKAGTVRLVYASRAVWHKHVICEQMWRSSPYSVDKLPALVCRA